MNTKPTRSETAAKNRKRGKAAEILVATRHIELGLDLIIKRIDRSNRQYSSLPDIEIQTRNKPLYIDVKYTEQWFSPKEKFKIWSKTIEKYGNECYCCFVEKDGKHKLNPETILIYHNLVIQYYDDFLRLLASEY